MTQATSSSFSAPDLSEAFDPLYEPESPMNVSLSSSNFAPLDQRDVNYMVAKANLSQRMAEWMTSFMKKKHATNKNVNSTAFRRRQNFFLNFSTTNGSKTTAYCKDLKGLLAMMKIKYDSKEWRLFIDGST